MKLQLALDRLSQEECFRLVRETNTSVDIIEIGTGVIKEYGMAIIREMRKEFPEQTILADMKICDAGEHEAKQAFNAGADIATVMAFAPQATIQDTHDVAYEYGKEMLVDLLEVHDRKRVDQLERLGVSFVGLHIGKDQQKKEQFSSGLFQLVEGRSLKIAVAGGVSLASLPEICKHQPDVIIVGSSITKADQPGAVAEAMKEKMREYPKN